MLKDEDHEHLVFSKWTQQSTCSGIVLFIHLVISVSVKRLSCNIVSHHHLKGLIQIAEQTWDTLTLAHKKKAL